MDDRLDARATRRLLDRLQGEPGATDRQRLETLIGLLDATHRFPLGAALAALFPHQEREAALNSYRALRRRLRKAATKKGLAFALAVDGHNRTPPERRWSWFEGENQAAREAADYARKEASAAQPEHLAPQDGLILEETRDGKRVIRYFVSYAHEDRKAAARLLKHLETRLLCSKEYHFERWIDGDILPGEPWREAIRKAIDGCHFGLLLVSYDFLASPFITRHELPHFLSPDPQQPVAWRRAIPVGLEEIEFNDAIDLKGLGTTQLFRDDAGKFFTQRTGTRAKGFVNELANAIEAVVRQHLDTPKHTPARRLTEHQRRHLLKEEELDCLVVPEGLVASLEKIDPDAGAPSDGQRLDALDFLERWARDPRGQGYFALLGEYGMGKTTTCKALTHRLLAARERDPATPLPIYFDLRHLGERAKQEPLLPEIIDTVLRRSWQAGPDLPRLSADEVIHLVREQGAIALFDGLDEVLVHLSTAAGQRFTRELWRILPPTTRREEEKGDPPRRGKLLLSCRTHYFRTLRDQKSHFTAEDRDGLQADDYRAFLLLPFTEAQIQKYFELTLPDESVERLLGLIRTIHNLPEMAERPYTLSLIARHIPQLEQWKAEGRTVTGATLYDHMVRSWLERDEGKHQLTPDHKRLLMGRFAATLWRAGERTWGVEELEQWLVDFLIDHPRIAAHYDGISRELLKEDLRTATFLVREGEERFRFAHTSLQEFFLAAHLRERLRAGDRQALDLPLPNREVFDFLGQLLSEERDERCLNTLKAVGDAYRPRASELTLAYALHAHGKRYPAPTLTGFHLEGARLRAWRLEGTPDRPLPLHDLQLQGADLTNARLRHLTLDGADLSGARLDRAEFIGGRAVATRFDRATLAGTLFRDLDLTAADFTGGERHRTQWLHCRLERTRGLPPADRGDPDAGLIARGHPVGRDTRPPTHPRALPFTGHAGSVQAVAASPDGTAIASA
ncbi:TIR domain-containing protein, partial [Endothiovibrio diazotrophicus]